MPGLREWRWEWSERAEGRQVGDGGERMEAGGWLRGGCGGDKSEVGDRGPEAGRNLHGRWFLVCRKLWRRRNGRRCRSVRVPCEQRGRHRPQNYERREARHSVTLQREAHTREQFQFPGGCFGDASELSSKGAMNIVCGGRVGVSPTASIYRTVVPLTGSIRKFMEEGEEAADKSSLHKQQ
ncbi:hypothetical protein E2C01_045475 [Portunus trituberculatus]|uniref:Uncharacterized protein n=1 Tax=Portunus trituberculatus TaxID=210409 RepID=A0A5B7G2D9_PORTR|nr:hypothetical protein [Portunus trituberculatus]